MAARRSHRDTSYHEAGHGVAHHYYHLSSRTKYLALESEELFDYNATRKDSEQAVGICDGQHSLPIIRGGQLDEEHLRHTVIAVLAGGEAQFIYAASYGSLGKGGDLEHAVELLHAAAETTNPLRDQCRGPSANSRGTNSIDEFFDSRERKVTEQFNAFRSETRNFVLEKWHMIQAVADALWKKRLLPVDEMIAIIERLEERVNDLPPELNLDAASQDGS